MKRTSKRRRKLNLSKQTVRKLTRDELDDVKGGSWTFNMACEASGFCTDAC